MRKEENILFCKTKFDHLENHLEVKTFGAWWQCSMPTPTPTAHTHTDTQIGRFIYWKKENILAVSMIQVYILQRINTVFHKIVNFSCFLMSFTLLMILWVHYILLCYISRFFFLFSIKYGDSRMLICLQTKFWSDYDFE